jgi:sarcosine oxidase subunit delta
MLLIRCPYCAMERPELEFRHAGAAHVLRPDPATASDADWAAFLYLRDNPRGEIAERWHHVHGCGRFFNAIRDTATDTFALTYKAGQARPASPQPSAKAGT